MPPHRRRRLTMERLLVVFLLCVIDLSFQEGIYNILGDSVEFSATKNCQKNGTKLVHRLTDVSLRSVAHRDGVWKPEPGYRDRMSPGVSVILNSTNINDDGLYELNCGPENETVIQLYVIDAFEVSVTEGEAAKLNFHHSTVGGTVSYIRCERNKELVFEVDLSSDNITYGAGFEERVSVSPDWKTQGDFSPTMQRVQLENQGDYFFSALDKEGKRTGRNPVVVRMRVKTNPDQITCPPPPVCPTQRPAGTKMETGTIAAAIAVIVLISAAGLVWWLKSRKSKVSCGRGAGRPAPDVEMGLLSGRGPGGSQVNGGPSRLDLNITDERPEM